jgi:hypothetical protein
MLTFDRSATVSLVGGLSVLGCLLIFADWATAGVFFAGWSIGGLRVSL